MFAMDAMLAHRPGQLKMPRPAAYAVAALINNYSTIGVESVEKLAASMMHYRLPSIMEERDYALGGVLMTCTESSADRDLRTTGLVAQILNGAKPADLPFRRQPASSWSST